MRRKNGAQGAATSRANTKERSDDVSEEEERGRGRGHAADPVLLWSDAAAVRCNRLRWSRA